MSIESPKYDVAISFLSKDEAIAAAIYQKLVEGLQVFFFPRSQEELAGTDGLESMRKPFFDDSRLMVVLYRERWGKTPWTGVEETAIKEACLEHGWERLFFIILEGVGALPKWLPATHVRFNFADYGLEQAVGAIKARVQERGGQPAPLTAMKRAEIFRAEEEFRRDKGRMDSEEGRGLILNSVSELFRVIEKQCADINERRFLQIRCGTKLEARATDQTCILTNDRVGLSVIWYQPYSNTLNNSYLSVREFSSGLILPGEARSYIRRPPLINEVKYSPDLSLAREYGWKQNSSTEFVSSSSLAEKCVIQFVDLANRSARGEIKRRDMFFDE